jgi:hypothetical protein
VPLVQGIEVQHDLESRFALREVDARHVDHQVHFCGRGVAQKACDVFPLGRIDDDGLVPVLRVRFEHGRREVLLEELYESLGHENLSE